jgi:predicted RNase H-like HicB family nuclease
MLMYVLLGRSITNQLRFIIRYLAIIEETNTGYSAYVPDLPCCISVGTSKEEVESHIQEPIIFHLEGIKEDGLAVLAPKSEGLNMLIPHLA